MIIRCVALLGILSCLLDPTAVLAESSDHLRDMLRRVPQGALVDDGPVSYVDYRAVESARPGAARPRSTEEWVALRDTGEAPFGLWLAAVRGIGGGSGTFLDAFVAAGEDQLSLVGFDFFDVDRELHFGEPPADGLVLAGRFDPEAIVTAHEAREFTATEVPGWMLICGAAGCDQGSAVDLQAVERADPFGGYLGRQQPLYVSHEILLSSAALGTVEAMRAASDGAAPSLADDVSVRMALDAIPDGGLVRQAMLVPSELLLADAGPMPTGEDGQDQSDRLGLQPMPPYRVALLVDTATRDEQVAHVVLAYTSEAAARSAADVLPDRVEAAPSVRADQTLRELLGSLSVVDVSSSVHVSPEGSVAAAILTLRAPLASPDLAATPIMASSLPYRLIVDMVVSRDARWLSPSSASGPGSD